MEAHPTRNFVLQIIKTLIWIVIAVGVIKFAFFPNQEEAPSLAGQGNFELPTVQVSRGDIENTKTFEATIARDQTKTFKSTSEGIVIAFFVDDGANVNAGDRVLQVRSETTTTPADPEAMPETVYRYHDIEAPVAGVVHFDVITQQPVGIGDILGSIQPQSFHAAVQLSPDQLYALQGVPSEAQILITDGPSPFNCTNLHTYTPAATPASQGGADTPASPELRCDIPSDQTVFEGLKAKLTITGDAVKDGLTLPITAVEGRYREANVYLPVDSPKEKPKPLKVQIGINDGSLVEITGGIEEGTEVLEFVPTLDEEDEGMDEFGGGAAF